MSQEINNREYRKNVIKGLLQKLHDGQTVDDVKQEFGAAFSGVSASEISEAEQALISEGMPVSEVQRLCDVHSAVFKGSIEEIQKPADNAEVPGHPAHTLMAENRALEQLMAEQLRPAMEKFSTSGSATELTHAIEKLREIDRHYLRKENLLFPYLEQYGITAPPKVMWGVDDEIRALLKEAVALAAAGDKLAVEKLEDAMARIDEMIFKEEHILLPMLEETLSQSEWQKIAAESDELGYCLIPQPPAWHAVEPAAVQAAPPVTPNGADVTLPTGFLSLQELTHLFNTLPVDITFVGKDDTVRYFSQSAERVFPRTKAIIGREVSNCHPPASVHIVEDIVADLKSGKKDHEDFWIKMGDKYIYIRYFAVRDEQGDYLGVLEVTQNIAPIQQISGEKRLVSE